jgi:hypothetical protein
MIVPQFWAEARIREIVRERQVTVRRFGWSDASAEDAQRHAEERAREAMNRIESGEVLARREPKVPYNGAEGVPIREEIVARHGDVIITRNSYGAICLNSPNALFADIDFQVAPSPAGCAGAFVAAVVIGIGCGVYFGSLQAFIIAGMVLSVAGAPVLHLLFRLRNQRGGGPEQRAMKMVETFVAARPEWRVRVYRTPAGYRVLAMHRPFDPNEDEALVFMDALKTDPIYQRMCRNQQCFRARLSAKPWRIGIDAHMKPRPGVWPVKPERMPDRLAWVARYEEAARDYAACRFVCELGDGAVDYQVDAVRRLHDDYCRAESGLPIA